MTEEEKKAIKTLIELYDYQRGKAIPGADDYIFNKEYKATGTVLNLIQKQQEEIEKKDKIIDKICDYFAGGNQVTGTKEEIRKMFEEEK